MSVDVGRPAAELAAQYHLPQLGGRPPLGRYLSKLWARRFFTVELARSRFRAENEQDRLGLAWTVLGPLINAAVYGFIFGVLLANDNRPPNFVEFLVVGVFTFQFFSACLQNGSKSIINNQALIRTLHFPRAVLPMAVVAQQIFVLGPMVAVMCLLVLAFGERIDLSWPLIVPALGLMAIFNFGVAFIAARITIHVRDVAQLIPFMTRLLFYVSGIFFSVDRIGFFERHPLVGHVFEVNPLNVYISLVRASILDAPEVPYATGQTWVLGVAWALAACLGGFIFFWRAEERYGRD